MMQNRENIRMDSLRSKITPQKKEPRTTEDHDNLMKSRKFGALRGKEWGFQQFHGAIRK